MAIRHFNALNLVTDRCPRIYGYNGAHIRGTQMVDTDDCEMCSRCKEIDYTKGLIACGQKSKITYTLLDFSPTIQEENIHIPQKIELPISSSVIV